MNVASSPSIFELKHLVDGSAVDSELLKSALKQPLLHLAIDVRSEYHKSRMQRLNRVELVNGEGELIPGRRNQFSRDRRFFRTPRSRGVRKRNQRQRPL